MYAVMCVCRYWAQIGIPVYWSNPPPAGVPLRLSVDDTSDAEHIATLSLETCCVERVLMLRIARLKSVHLPLSAVLERPRRLPQLFE